MAIMSQHVLVLLKEKMCAEQCVSRGVYIVKNKCFSVAPFGKNEVNV